MAVIVNVTSTTGAGITVNTATATFSGTVTVTTTTGAGIAVSGGTATFSGLVFTAAYNCTIAGNLNIGQLTANGSTFTVTGQSTITIGSGSMGALTVNLGVLTLGSDITVAGALTLTTGTIISNRNITANNFVSSGTLPRFLEVNGQITLTGNGTVWNCATSTNMILAGLSTIILNDATANNKTFAGGSLSYHDIWLTGAGTGQFLFTGSNTFNNFKCDTPPHTIGFTGGTTTTVRAFLVSGIAANLITLTGIAGAAWNLTLLGGGTTSSDYLAIDHMTGNPAATWYVGSHSTDNGNNHNLSFTDNATPPRATIDRYGVTFLDGTNQMSASN